MIDAEFRDRALYLPGAGTLVLADLHLGREATSAVQIPLGERRDITSRLADLLDQYRPTRVVLAGDVLHSFSDTPGEAAESFDRVVRLVESRDATLLITPGNHDAMLGGLWSGDSIAEFTLEIGARNREDNSREDDGNSENGENGENGNTRSGKRDGTIVVTHGHELPEMEAGTYVIGHDHPAIEIEGQRRPCYLYGPGAHEGADVLMLPAFTRLAGGVEINGLHARELQSPLLTDLGEFRPIVYDEESEEALWFPPLAEFRSML
ncbi:metallophosphoesterase [Halobacteriales archaeon QS_3_64_16]|nr:MAG: metallophosphoesterase [Halobacteriales archaeon QS_3_64_16]